MAFSLDFFLPIRTCCRLPAGLFLLLTLVSLIILQIITRFKFTWKLIWIWIKTLFQLFKLLKWVLHIGLRPSCQDKKCTSVNNRCIQSKISGDNIDCRRVELSANVTLARSRWMSNYYITPATGSSNQSEKRCWNANHVTVEHPRWMRKKCYYSHKSWGGVNMLQSLFSLQLTSHTQPFQ